MRSLLESYADVSAHLFCLLNEIQKHLRVNVWVLISRSTTGRTNAHCFLGMNIAFYFLLLITGRKKSGRAFLRRYNEHLLNWEMIKTRTL